MQAAEFLRVETVHQGHQDGRLGLYYINAVDTLTQGKVVGCVETICERHLLPVLEAMLFFTAHLNPYLNFHRPCGFATIRTSKRGRRKRIYRTEDYRMPFEKLTSLPKWEQFLKPCLDAEHLRRAAQKMPDTEAAQDMQKAKLAVLAKSRGLK